MTFYKRPKVRRERTPIAVVAFGTDGRMSAIADGVTFETDDPTKPLEWLRCLRGTWRVFAISDLSSVVDWSDRMQWDLVYINGRLRQIKLDDGPTIKPTRGIFRASSVADAYETINRVDQWLLAHNARFSSLGWTAEQLWTNTLNRPFSFHSETGNRGFYGGRKQAAPGAYHDMNYVDIGGAYTHSMVAEGIPRGLKPLTNWRAAKAGIAKATVTTFDNDLVPIPQIDGFRMSWVPGKCTAWYPIVELKAAESRGAIVEVHDIWSGTGMVFPFNDFVAIIDEGKSEFSGQEKKIVKAIGNALWGTFGFTGTKNIRRYNEDGTRRKLATTRLTRNLGSTYIAAEIAGRVRARITTELLPSAPYYIDTDGGIVASVAPLPTPTGDERGRWSVRENMESVEIKGTGAYAFRRFDGTEDVVLSGIPDATRLDFERGRGLLDDGTNFVGLGRDIHRLNTAAKNGEIRRKDLTAADDPSNLMGSWEWTDPREPFPQGSEGAQ